VSVLAVTAQQSRHVIYFQEIRNLVDVKKEDLQHTVLSMDYTAKAAPYSTLAKRVLMSYLKG
jgi:hypothetical protein